MKKIFNLLVVFSLVFVYSCDDNSDFDTDDQLTGTSLSGGAIVDVNVNSNGKLLGIPSSLDFDTATVAFASNEVDLEILLLSGGQDVSSYEITKSLNGGEDVVVATGSSLPLGLTYSTIDEFIDGLGVSATDLRIGDVIAFRTKFVHSDGRVSYSGPNDGTFSITVNCSSALAGTYDTLLHYVRASTATDTWYQFEDTWAETSPGVYRTTEVGPWIGGLGVGVAGMTVEDVCGELTVPEQNLVEFYSNIVLGGGAIDGTTGIITLDYTICASDCRELYATYTPK